MSESREGFVPYPADLAEDYRRKGHWKGRTFGEYLDDWAECSRREEILSPGLVTLYPTRSLKTRFQQAAGGGDALKG